MDSKFENLVQRQKELLDEDLKSSLKSAFNNAAAATTNFIRNPIKTTSNFLNNNPMARNFASGTKQGSRESEAAYKDRMINRGEIELGLKNNKTYVQGTYPLLIKYDVVYGGLKAKIEPKGELANNNPTIYFINDGIDYEQEMSLDKQGGFLKACVDHITLDSINPIKSDTAGQIHSGQLWTRYNYNGILKHFYDVLSKAPPSSYTVGDTTKPAEMLSSDTENYKRTLNKLLLNDLGTAMQSILKKTLTFAASKTEDDFNDAIKISFDNVYDQFYKAVKLDDPSAKPTTTLIESSKTVTEATKNIFVKIMSIAAQTGKPIDTLNSFIQAMDSDFMRAIGCQRYPAYVSAEKLHEFYCKNLAGAINAKGVDISKDLFFVSPEEIKIIEEKVKNLYGKRAFWFAADKVSEVVKNAIMHPFKTAEKIAGAYGYNTAVTTNQQSS